MKFLILVVFCFVFISCREEVISPDNPAGNINQPVIERYLNSYSFVLNAGDITYNVYEYMVFDYSRTQIFLSVLDHSSGYVDIQLYSKTKQIVFNKKVIDEIEGETSKIEAIPETLHLNFKDFTGKIRISVTRN